MRRSYHRSQSERRCHDSDSALRSFYSRRSQLDANTKEDEESEWLGYPPLAIPELQSVTSGSSNLTEAETIFEKPPPVSVVFNKDRGLTTSKSDRYLSSSQAPEPYRYSRASSGACSNKYQQPLASYTPSIRHSIRSSQTGYYSYDADFSTYMTESEVSSSAGENSFGGDSGGDDNMMYLSRNRLSLDVDRHERPAPRPSPRPSPRPAARPVNRPTMRHPMSGHRFKTEESALPRQESFKSIEVTPGQFMKLRGSEETWRAVCNDFYMPGECQVCNNTIFCIQDADYVLCPTCRVVSPMDQERGSRNSDGGVGLGFTMKDLAAWQAEIAQSRR